jgi:hypothetical protein
MDHHIILDVAEKEIEELVDGTRSMIIQGSDDGVPEYGRFNKGDVLYLMYDYEREDIRAKCVVDSVINSGSLSRDESYKLIIDNQDKLMLHDDLFYRWAGKKYLVLVSIKNIEKVDREPGQGYLSGMRLKAHS